MELFSLPQFNPTFLTLLTLSTLGGYFLGNRLETMVIYQRIDIEYAIKILAAYTIFVGCLSTAGRCLQLF